MYEDGQKLGKRRPSTAAADYARVEDLEVNLSTGSSVIDMVVEDLLDPENRSIMLNPNSRFSGVAVCDAANFDTHSMLTV